MQISFTTRVQKFLAKKWVIAIIALVVIVGGIMIVKHSGGSAYQFIPVTRGPIDETVSITGNTVPSKSVSLAFGGSGIISNVSTDLGEQVLVGQVLASLNMNDLEAGLHQAEANVDGERARLEGLQTGARPEDIALYRQKYTDATSALLIAMRNAYLQAQNAVLHYADTLFVNGTGLSPTLNVGTQSRAEELSAEGDRVIAGQKLDDWQTALASLTASSSDATIASVRATGTDAASFISGLLDKLSAITNNLNTNSSAMTQAQIDADRTAINTAAQTLGSGVSAEQSAYAAWASASQTLVSEESASKPTDVSAQSAALEAAEANVESAQAKIQNAEIVAPISGTITQFDAKIGQLASPGTPLVSIMSDSGYEVDAGVSETDVGKLAIGDAASMTLDAFPNETFTGSVFYIAPSETNSQGVVSYQVKISFTTPDPRLKSGLTANIDIQTKHKDNVLTLPQYAILQNDSGTFVETLNGSKVVDTPVTLGIQDQKGNVEVVSGVTEGEQVLNIGLKSE